MNVLELCHHGLPIACLYEGAAEPALRELKKSLPGQDHWNKMVAKMAHYKAEYHSQQTGLRLHDSLREDERKIVVGLIVTLSQKLLLLLTLR